MGVLIGRPGGTGFISDGHNNNATYKPAIGRLSGDRRSYTPDVVVLDLGRDDEDGPKTTAAARRNVAAVHRSFPKAQVVLIAPYFLTDTREWPHVAALCHQLDKRPQTGCIDPVREGRINKSITGKVLISDGVHPDPAGHQYVARHLAADMKRVAHRV